MRRLILCFVLLALVTSTCKKSSAPGPEIIALSTDRAGVGFPVTIIGKNFGNSPSSVSVKFNQITVLPTLVQDTIIVVIVPPGATSGPLTVFIDNNPVPGNNYFYILTGTWTRLIDMPFSPGRILGAGFTINAQGYFFGGTDNGAKYNNLYLYDPPTHQWYIKSPWPGPGIQEMVCFTINEKAYLGIGKTDTGLTNQFWEYDPAGNNWTRKSDFPGTSRSGVFSFSVGSFGYVGDIGGTADFWMYDEGLDKWSQKANSPVGVNSQWATSFVIGDKGYCGTGLAGNEFWEYTPSLDSWTRMPNFPGNGGQTTLNAVGFTINQIGYVSSGGECWAFDPVARGWSQVAFFGFRNAGSGFAIGGEGYYVGGTTGTDGNQTWQFSPQ